MQLVFPDTTEIVDAIRGAIGRIVSFMVETKTACTNPECYLEPVTDTSTNSFCPICSGNYWIVSLSGVTTSGFITWGVNDVLWVPGGTHIDGDVRVQIKYMPELVTVMENTNSLKIGEKLVNYMVVDNTLVKINKIQYRGTPEINRILIDCIVEKRDE